MSERARRVLGIDPGTRVTGWGVVETSSAGGMARLVAYGTLRPPATAPLPARLALIFRELQQVLSEQRPDLVAVEDAFSGRHPRSALKLAEGRAVCLLAAQLAGLPIHEVPPALVKKSVTGHGRAGKETVRDAVLRALGWEAEAAVPAFDASDALAAALTVMLRLEAPAGLAGLSGKRTKGRRRKRWTSRDVERLPQG